MINPAADEMALVTILDRLINLPWGPPCDELALFRDRKRVLSLAGRYPALAHAILGLMAGITLDEPQMRYYFEKARREVNPATDIGPMVCMNHVASLMRFACFFEAETMAERDLAAFPLSGSLGYSALSAHLFCGHIQAAARMLETRWAAEMSVQQALYVKEILPCAQFLQKQGVSDRKAAVWQDHAAALLRHRRLPVQSVEIKLTSDETTTWVSFYDKVRLPEPELAELNQEFHSRLVGAGVADAAFFRVMFRSTS